MSEKEQDSFLNEYIAESQRHRVQEGDLGVIDEVMNGQLFIDSFDLSDIKTFSESVVVRDNASYYSTTWGNEEDNDDKLTIVVCIANTEAKNELILPDAINASFEKELYTLKGSHEVTPFNSDIEPQDVGDYPLHLITPYLFRATYDLKRASFVDDFEHQVEISGLDESVSPFVSAFSITRFASGDIHDVSIGALFLRDNYKVRKVFGGDDDYVPRVVYCFNGKYIVRGEDGRAKEISKEDLKEIGVGVSYKDTKENANLTVSVFGTTFLLRLDKQLRDFYAAGAVLDGKWITDDSVERSTWPISSLN